eukprot:CAMPEP_0202485516 /NCGR_PEP_ID=MMETSP1361-20130828/4345_1 /ASSEMBLY_ACC=CAM_ASM_000849 /TAXON_ID=210615 /ORGANISM="Staurosira complex sp., Strain CCMP2646" /LENGTH=211 /DNA_ID=CAMNT_0049114441 /DNA_START=17 /DNA_END=652 /DNA_ORIENTATION=+
MMLRLSFLFLGLFTYHTASAQVCNPCGIAGYYPTAPDNTRFSDGAGGTLTCGRVKQLAQYRKQGQDACSIMVSYCRTHCRCKNSRGQLAPPLRYKSSTQSCRVGTPASYKMQYTPPVAVAGLQMKCMFWQRFAGQGAFTQSQCPQVQNLMSRYCYSRRRNLRGDEQEEEIHDSDYEEFEDDYDYENDPEYQEAMMQLLEMKEEELLFPLNP